LHANGQDFKLKYEPNSNEIPAYFPMDFGDRSPVSEAEMKKSP